jgi:hypothetical protein
MVTLVISRQEDGDKLIASLAYLASRLRKADIVAKFEHRFVPRDRMKIHRVQKRAIQVEDSGFRQFDILHRESITNIARSLEVAGDELVPILWERFNDNARRRPWPTCDFPRMASSCVGAGKNGSLAYRLALHVWHPMTREAT